MTLVSQAFDSPGSAFRYLDDRRPITFPESEKVPETQEHLELRTLAHQLLVDALGDKVTVGGDQFVYLDAEDPTEVLAPDVYIRLAPSVELIRSWKVWERGAPDVCVEFVSESDSGAPSWQAKLDRYRRLGTRELIRFDSRDARRPLRIWDRVEGRLLERDLGDGASQSLVLGLDWVVGPLERLKVALRVAKDGVLVPSRAEARARAEQNEEQERQAKEQAWARVRELEAELRRR